MRRFLVSMGLGGLTSLASIPGIAFGAPQTFAELVALIVLIINVATPTLVGLALVFFLYRMVAVSYGGGEKGGAQGLAPARVRKVALTGIGILFVMVSIWGILRVIEATFLTSGDFGGESAPPDPCVSLGDC